MLRESPGPSEQAVPDCVAHIAMLTEKVNALRRRVNEGCQKWRDDILHISSDEEEELIPAHVACQLRQPHGCYAYRHKFSSQLRV